MQALIWTIYECHLIFSGGKYLIDDVYQLSKHGNKVKAL